MRAKGGEEERTTGELNLGIWRGQLALGACSGSPVRLPQDYLGAEELQL